MKSVFLRTCIRVIRSVQHFASSAVAVVCALAGFRACRIAGRRRGRLGCFPWISFARQETARADLTGGAG